MAAHAARYRLSPTTAKVSHFDELFRHLIRDPEPSPTQTVVGGDKIRSALAYLLERLHKERKIGIYTDPSTGAVVAEWPHWTRRWAEHCWDGDEEPPEGWEAPDWWPEKPKGLPTRAPRHRSRSRASQASGSSPHGRRYQHRTPSPRGRDYDVRGRQDAHGRRPRSLDSASTVRLRRPRSASNINIFAPGDGDAYRQSDGDHVRDVPAESHHGSSLFMHGAMGTPPPGQPAGSRVHTWIQGLQRGRPPPSALSSPQSRIPASPMSAMTPHGKVTFRRFLEERRATRAPTAGQRVYPRSDRRAVAPNEAGSEEDADESAFHRRFPSVPTTPFQHIPGPEPAQSPPRQHMNGEGADDWTVRCRILVGEAHRCRCKMADLHVVLLYIDVERQSAKAAITYLGRQAGRQAGRPEVGHGELGGWLEQERRLVETRAEAAAQYDALKRQVMDLETQIVDMTINLGMPASEGD